MELKHRFLIIGQYINISPAWWVDIKGQTGEGYVLCVTKVPLANTCADKPWLITEAEWWVFRCHFTEPLALIEGQPFLLKIFSNPLGGLGNALGKIKRMLP